VGASRCKTFHGLPWGYELGTEGLSITIEINCLGELIKLTSVFFQSFFLLSTYHTRLNNKRGRAKTHQAWDGLSLKCSCLI
jgi:hypothetical protein